MHKKTASPIRRGEKRERERERERECRDGRRKVALASFSQKGKELRLTVRNRYGVVEKRVVISGLTPRPAWPANWGGVTVTESISVRFY